MKQKENLKLKLDTYPEQALIFSVSAFQNLKRHAFPRALRVHHVPPLSRETVFADKTVKFGGFKENRLAGQSNALQPAFAHPAHDRRAMHMPEMEGGFTEGQQGGAGGAGAAGRQRFAGSRPARGNARRGYGLGNHLHGGRSPALCLRRLTLNLCCQYPKANMHCQSLFALFAVIGGDQQAPVIIRKLRLFSFSDLIYLLTRYGVLTSGEAGCLFRGGNGGLRKWGIVGIIGKDEGGRMKDEIRPRM